MPTVWVLQAEPAHLLGRTGQPSEQLAAYACRELRQQNLNCKNQNTMRNHTDFRVRTEKLHVQSWVQRKEEQNERSKEPLQPVLKDQVESQELWAALCSSR